MNFRNETEKQKTHQSRTIMDIFSLSFEEPLIITINEQSIRLVLFKTQENGNIKFGIEAPRSIDVYREEIYQAIQSKQQASHE